MPDPSPAPRNKGGRPRLSKLGPARTVSLRLRPEDSERLARLQARLGGVSPTAAIRHLLARAR